MQRRRFLFWIGFGLFSLGERLQAAVFDDLAAAALNRDHSNSDAAKNNSSNSATATPPTHWRAASNSAWCWYERETLIDGHWMLSGVTTPIHRETGEPYTGQKGYLDESLVPAEIRVWVQDDQEEPTTTNDPPVEHLPDPKRRARHGRPPSKWLRSLYADELRIWLKTIDVPEAGVSGMTYMTHLTRDHFFDADKIEGLTIDEQAKLHAAAHHGY